jgi:hypothetical protein
MALSLKNISLSVDDQIHIHGTTLELAPSGFDILLGATLAGKTTVLNIISGLRVPSEGSVSFDGEVVNGKQPDQRQIVQVFQLPVLYDTMTVYDNLAFSLRNRGVPENQVDQRGLGMPDPDGHAAALHTVPDAADLLVAEHVLQDDQRDPWQFPQEFILDNYVTILTDPTWYSGYINSLIYVRINRIISVAVTLPAAYAFSRYRFLGDKHLFFWLLTNRMAPAVVFALLFFQLYSAMGLLDTHIAKGFALGRV